MGHWAQNRRRGSTPPGGLTPLVEMISATITDVLHVDVGYDGVVDAALFAGADFASEFVSDQAATVVLQNGVAGLTLTFAFDLTGDTVLQYSGSVAGVTTPQSINYT